MNIERLIGFVAATLTTISFLPQAYHSLRTRDTRSISLGMYMLFTLGVALWLVYC
ncbi:MAG: PQ-loop domain-containing transporter, partial [Gammaproteobacteria bacterium]